MADIAKLRTANEIHLKRALTIKAKDAGFGCILRVEMNCLNTPSLIGGVPSMRSVAVEVIFSLPLVDMLERIWVIRDKTKTVSK